MKKLVSTVIVFYPMVIIIDLRIALANYLHISLMSGHNHNSYNQLQVGRKIFEN